MQSAQGGYLASLGQLRNSRLPALTLGRLVCSARFRLAASRTAGASAPRPADGERSCENDLSPSSPPQEFSLRSVRFAIVTWLRCRLPGSFTHHASASLYPAQRALRLRASESAMDERSSYNCALRKLRDLNQPESRLRFPRPLQPPFAWFPAGLPTCPSHKVC